MPFATDEHFAKYLPEYENLQALKDHYTRGGLGDVKVKKFLNNVLQETLGPIRERRRQYAENIEWVYEVLKKGSDEARKVAGATLDEMNAAMKINYFEDADFLKDFSNK